MADADRLVAALNYLQEQKPADPLESFRSLAGLRDAYERRVQPIINNARQTFSTGGAMGDLLRSYGDAAAPGNAAALQGMGIPFKGPMTAPREEGFSSGKNFRPMGDPQQQFAGQLLGDPMNVQPMIAPAARGAVAVGKYAGPELARGLENYMVKSGGILPMDTWHGSPHRFPPTAKNPLGEFDPTKIGTGEGAQAYGAGAGYLAEAKGTGIGYRDQLAIDPRNSVNEVRAALSNSGRGSYWGQGENIPTLDDISLEMKRHQTLSPYFNDNTFKKDILKIIQGTDRNGVVTDEVINILRRLDKTMPKPSGYLYKVDLADEQIPKMLDWNKPFDKQHPEVQQALVNIANSEEEGSKMLKLMQNGNPSGKDIFHSLLTEPQLIDSPNGWISVDNKKEISKLLQNEGIPGIRYLDQGSRAAGEGTSNFVVFDPAHMNIIGRE